MASAKRRKRGKIAFALAILAALAIFLYLETTVGDGQILAALTNADSSKDGDGYLSDYDALLGLRETPQPAQENVSASKAAQSDAPNAGAAAPTAPAAPVKAR